MTIIILPRDPETQQWANGPTEEDFDKQLNT